MQRPVRGWRNLKTAWDEALASIDMAILLDRTEPEAQAAAEAARAILTRLGARPFLERLDAAMAWADEIPDRQAAGDRSTSPGAVPTESPVGPAG